eukprot:3877803-Alexandrium_andersonii.AAC.1
MGRLPAEPPSGKEPRRPPQRSLAKGLVVGPPGPRIYAGAPVAGMPTSARSNMDRRHRHNPPVASSQVASPDRSAVTPRVLSRLPLLNQPPSHADVPSIWHPRRTWGPLRATQTRPHPDHRRFPPPAPLSVQCQPVADNASSVRVVQLTGAQTAASRARAYTKTRRCERGLPRAQHTCRI